MRKGLTLPNRQWDPYTRAELAALDELGPETLVWLLYGHDMDRVHAEQLRPFLSREPTTRILFRPYADDIPNRSAVAWATVCDLRIRQVGIPGELIPANEMNLASEGGSEMWSRQIVWLESFALAWRRLQATTLLHLPGLSPSGNYRAGLFAYRDAGLGAQFDVVDFHCYSVEDLVDAASFGALFGRPVSITEFNRIDPRVMSRRDFGPADVRDAVYFLLGGTPDQSEFDLSRRPQEYAAFRDWGVEKVANFRVGEGVLALMAVHNDKPKSDEHYVVDSVGNVFKSETFGSKGIYQWNKAANETVLVPFG